MLNVSVASPETNDGQQYFTVDIPGTPLAEAQKDWKNYIQKHSDGEGNLINGEYIQEGVVNKSISTDPFTAYSGFQQSTNAVTLRVWLKQNNQPFPGAHNVEAVKKFVRDFAVIEYRNYTSDKLKAEEKKLSDLEGQLASINKAENKSIKNSGSNTRENERAEESINTNAVAIENSSKKIEDQGNMINQTSADKNANDGAKKTLKEMEDEKKDLQKKNEKESKKIEDRNEENRQGERNLVDSQADRTRLQTDIETQKVVVQNLQQELSSIN